MNRYNNDWNRPGLTKCVHAFIGELEDGTIATCQTLPWNKRGWHVGSGRKGRIPFHRTFRCAGCGRKGTD